MLSNDRIVAFDTDGTLVTHDGKPRLSIIKKLTNAVANPKNKVIVWSNGGARHAQSVGKKLGLKGVTYHSKKTYGKTPDVNYDDEETNLGKRNIMV